MTICPPISGREQDVAALMLKPRQAWSTSPIKFEQLRSGFACALHMHQPTVPAGAGNTLISHLQYMLDHPNEGDNHNAEPFAHCYRRLAELLPELINEGCAPRIMLDYSGNLLWGIEQMGRRDIGDALHYLACDPLMQEHVEWLGTFWSHAVAPSTPIPDLKLQISAWQQQFEACFGRAALERVKGFSPPEMALPNHPDTLFEFVKALKDAGYQWLLVQEHSVERIDGSPLQRDQCFVPNRLVARNSKGEETCITALIKTQGSDTKLVGQMQPYYEALGCDRQQLGEVDVPSLVSQIADGENGGVMMNEFPEAFRQANRQIRDNPNGTVAINGSEYIEALERSGVNPSHFPTIQAVQQHRLWREAGDNATADGIQSAINRLSAADAGFNMEGASWTNNLSWVEGYANVLGPMNQLSAQFHALFDQTVDRDSSITCTQAYQESLLHVLLLETSCFRYWGQGAWTDYAHEIHRRGNERLSQEDCSKLCS
ncbi:MULTISPECIES: glycosyl hydrolase family 57 [unclassified Synechococcus]|uniref:glycosyl hydrolase family 57 n=1 Tax=unclassified Synechococcus TaxID=2626047 RepID=UPI001CF88A49|nr:MULTISPECIES: glycosyl hydrolase family 57 [unclassified Synechococcus]MCB4378096.1 glycosyl hydrolase family 57 [Synechococcus sp. MU1650]MCB4398680.1 glycosyl hydrolase family 57 [Synechococcus sp. MU1625]MCB4412525.1 glycosyl hydrolase family 57 [Synechococcus sp. MU1611]